MIDIRLWVQILTEAVEGLSFLHSTQGDTPAVVHLDVKRYSSCLHAAGMQTMLMMLLCLYMQLQHPT